jgi:hypothetical protein
MKLTNGTNGTTLDTLPVPNAKNLSQFYGSGGQMMHKKAHGGMVSVMDQMALPVLKGPPLKPVLFAKAKAKGGQVSKLKRGGVF